MRTGMVLGWWRIDTKRDLLKRGELTSTSTTWARGLFCSTVAACLVLFVQTIKWATEVAQQQQMQMQHQTLLPTTMAIKTATKNTTNSSPSPPSTTTLLPLLPIEATNTNSTSPSSATTRATLPLPEATTTKKKNSTLVVVLGSLRGGEDAWDSLYRNVLDRNMADLALVTGAKENKTFSSMYLRAKFVWEFPEYGDDWSPALDAIGRSATQGAGSSGSSGIITWRDIARNTSGPSSILGPVPEISPLGSGAINYYARWVLSQRIRDLDLHDVRYNYDRFVVTRSDHYYLCPHPLDEFLSDYVWLPRGEDYGGLQDRHVVCGGGQDVLSVLDILPPLVLHPEKYLFLSHKMNATLRKRFTSSLVNPISHSNVAVMNPEKLVALRWHENGIQPRVRRFRRVMFTVSAPGDPPSRGMNPPKWYQPPKSSPGNNVNASSSSTSSSSLFWNRTKPGTGLGIKYAGEHLRSMQTCHNFRLGKRTSFAIAPAVQSTYKKTHKQSLGGY